MGLVGAFAGFAYRIQHAAFGPLPAAELERHEGGFVAVSAYTALDLTPAGLGEYVARKIVSPSHFLKAALSWNCLKSSVWSVRRSTMTRCNALSCSMRAFCLSEFFIAFR